MAKPSIPKGTRDFSPEEMIKRDYIFDTIKSVFRLYGYQPVETPAMENLSTLLGKYGEEGDKLIFRILNSGDFLSSLSNDDLSVAGSAKLSQKICEKGLRYDLTVPFARYVVQHQSEIAFPFKRYQIQPVWRADRPQKGRYREFFQCDVDVIGSDSLLNEYELLKIIDDIFRKLNISVTIKINHRKLLTGLAEIAGESDKLTDILVAIDKLEKSGIEAVVTELLSKGVSNSSIDKLRPLIMLEGNNSAKLGKLESVLAGSESGSGGISELRTMLGLLEGAEFVSRIELDLTLARGLNYYTGIIIEVKSNDFMIGSICGGGRYDNLTGIFGLEGVSGVGVSFGADRIYDVMTGLSLFDEEKAHSANVMIVNFGGDSERYSLRLLERLHKSGVSAEIYPDQVKIKKQFAYADSKKVPYVVIAGEDEIRNSMITVKNMAEGSQISISPDEIESYFIKS